jgi:hypothetical protein
MKSLDILKESCYGWVNKKRYVDFKNKKRTLLIVDRIRTKESRKKIFIQ